METTNNNEDYDSDDYEPEYEPESFTVGDQMIPLEVLSLVPPPLEFMSNLHSHQQEISGRQVWCGSLLLAQTLCHIQKKQQDLFHTKRILELGSGTGLLGMVLSKLRNPPSCVVLTDGDEKAIELLHKNVENPKNKIDRDVVQVKLLRWGEALEDLFQFCQTTWDCLWSNKEDDKKNKIAFDYLIAGDVLYKKELPDLFFQTVDALLDDNGILFLCHVPRSTVTHDIVVEAAKKKNFSIETIPFEEFDIEGCPQEERQAAKIYRITKQQQNCNQLTT